MATLLIVDTEVCKAVKEVFKPGIFKIRYVEIIAQWCFNYYDQYKQAPRRLIYKIFEREKKDLKPGLERNIEDFLFRLNREWEDSVLDANENPEYFIEQIKGYIDTRIQQTALKEALELLDRGDKDEAQSLIQALRGARPKTQDGRSLGIKGNFIDQTEIMQKKNLFSLADRSLGTGFEDLAGPFRRGHLFSFLAPMKGGKSFFLQEVTFQAAEHGLKALYVSLEMPDYDVLERFKYRLTATAERPGTYTMPVFDCLANQRGNCKMDQRENSTVLIKSGPTLNRFRYQYLPKFDYNNFEQQRYRPCTYCRSAPGQRENYLPSIWFKPVVVGEYNESIGWKKWKAFQQYLRGDIYFKSYPLKSCSVRMLNNFVDNKEDEEGQKFDLVIVDYADLLREDSKTEFRHQLNSIWEGLKQMAMDRDIAIVTASQTNRQAIKKNKFQIDDIAEDVRKAATVDAMIGILQSNEDKDYNVCRVNCLVHRHRPFNPNNILWVTQNLYIGHPIIDCEWVK